MNLNFRIVEYCAQECEWQRSGEMSVARMVAAWTYAARVSVDRWPNLEDVLALGRLIEPDVNCNGLRTWGVQVGTSVKMKAELVPRALETLLSIVHAEMTERERLEWFRQYEEIHPFGDGNGRSGSLLWNWISYTLADPLDAPNLWSQKHRGAPHPLATDPEREAMIELYQRDLIDGTTMRELIKQSRKEPSK